MKLYDLSHVIASGMRQWPGDDQPLELHRRRVHGPDSHMSSSLEFGCHVGTHLDGALHFLAGQEPLDQVPLQQFWGPAQVVDASFAGADPQAPQTLTTAVLQGVDLSAIDFVLLHTGWDRHWDTDIYYRHWPYLSAELARVLAEAGLKGVGLDTPSLDAFDGSLAHDLCAAAGMVNIENLKGLGPLAGQSVQFMALPLKLKDTEASPVRAVAWLAD